MKNASPVSSGHSTARDMTSGPILQQIVLFSLPLLLGNVFQMLYNTVDTLVVGNFVGTQALAAVGSTTMITNLMVFFFNGLSLGATVIIGQCFGAKDLKSLHVAIETTMAMTFLMGVVLTILGLLLVKPMLLMMSTPDDVFPEATLYLRTYVSGISGLMLYNMGSGILRAVGDTTRPLYFLILTSVMNIFLDLLFVIVFHAGIMGVALATIIAQFISAILVLYLLTTTNDIYKFVWKDLMLDLPTFGRIFAIGFPTALQSMITAFSNIFVQSYVNFFGSACMAGWSCFQKMEQFILIPMTSLSSGATTFVSQNIGAKQVKRANKGTVAAVLVAVGITVVLAGLLYLFAGPVTGIFSKDSEVISFGTLFIHTNALFMILNCINHTLAGALRGRGDSKGPMVIMLLTFVGIRQVYLFVATRFIANTALVVGLGYPIGWTFCCIIEVAYFFLRWGRQKDGE